MCDQDHFEKDREEYEALGLVTRKQFGIMLGAGVAMMLPKVANAVAVAEQTLGMMLAMARHLSRADALMHAGKWEKKSLQGTELRGKTLGIVGLGRVGVEVARLGKAFGSYDDMRQRDDKELVEIYANLFVERDSQKGIIIGPKGSRCSTVASPSLSSSRSARKHATASSRVRTAEKSSSNRRTPAASRVRSSSTFSTTEKVAAPTGTGSSPASRSRTRRKAAASRSGGIRIRSTGITSGDTTPRKLRAPSSAVPARRASAAALYSGGHNYLARRPLRHPGQVLAARRIGRWQLLSVPELAALAHLRRTR